MRTILRFILCTVRTALIILLICAYFLFYDVPETEAPGWDVQFKYFVGRIHVDGIEYANYDLTLPILYSDLGEYYIPVNTKDGYPVSFNLENHNNGQINCDREASTLGYKDPETLVVTTYYGKYEYISVTDMNEYFPCSCRFDDVAGLYISTDPDGPVNEQVAEEDRAYILGLATYMQNACYKEELSLETALRYEYLFHHASREYGVDEILLMAVCHVESSFWNGDHSQKGARGLMQIMASSARAQNVDPDELWDPHVNIDFGAMYIRDRIYAYNGDITKALCAYNMGMAKVNSGNYSTKYANLVFKRQSQIEKWLTK